MCVKHVSNLKAEHIRIREVMSNMEKCGQSKSDRVDPKLDDNNRHPANRKDESEFLCTSIDF